MMLHHMLDTPTPADYMRDARGYALAAREDTERADMWTDESCACIVQAVAAFILAPVSCCYCDLLMVPSTHRWAVSMRPICYECAYGRSY